MNKKSVNKIGKASKIIGYILTYGVAFLIIFGYHMDKSIKGFLDVFILLVLINIVIFLGKYNYKLYDNYKKYNQDDITKDEYKKIWYKSLISTFLISLTIFPVIFLIPQYILLYKTNENFIPEKYYKRKNKTNSFNKRENSSQKNIIGVSSLTQTEIIIMSLILGTITALILGYLFCKPEYDIQYVTNVVSSHSNRTRSSRRKTLLECEFNLVLAIGGFVILGGLLYLFLNKKYGK